jgi:hypothetical protein
MGRRGIFQVGTRTAQRFADRRDRFALADDSLGHFVFHREQALRFASFHALHGDAGPLCDHMENVLFIHFDALLLAARFPCRQHSLNFFFGVLLLVAHRRRAFEVLLANRLFFLALDLIQLAFERFDFGGRVIAPMRAREPASSMRSIALSGKKRSVM